jgi:hypothetical protein
MFVGDETQLEVGFDAAQAGLATLVRGGSLTAVSAKAYGEGLTGLAQVGPPGSVRGISRLVKARSRYQVTGDEAAMLTLRWEATGPGGLLFPALDADVTLTPAAEHATLLRLAAAYRPPHGSLEAGIDQVILLQVATATIRTFMNLVADTISGARRVTETPPGGNGGRTTLG